MWTGSTYDKGNGLEVICDVVNEIVDQLDHLGQDIGHVVDQATRFEVSPDMASAYDKPEVGNGGNKKAHRRSWRPPVMMDRLAGVLMAK